MYNDKMDKIAILEKLGLKQNDARVYLALLDQGPSHIAMISQRSGLHRPIIYKSLPVLIEKRLVTKTIRKKRAYFMAEPPNRLETLFDDFRIDFFETLPELEDMYSTNTHKPRVRFLEGKDGTKRVFDDVVRSMKKGETFFRYSSNKDGKEKKDKYIPRGYRMMRDQKKLERLVITNFQTANHKSPKLDRFVKIIPSDFGPFEYNVTEIIYEDKIAYIDYNSETVMIIESRHIADFERHKFKQMYKYIH